MTDTPAALPLSKYYDPADLDQLGPELAIVDRHFTEASPQSEHRRWEYAMALHALRVFELQTGMLAHTSTSEIDGAVLYDVGGAGSPFLWMPPDDQPRVESVIVIDQAETRDDNYKHSLAEDIQAGSFITAPAVFCLSVLEHVDDLDQFCYHLSCLTAPGGLLFLTVDCCGCGWTWPEGERKGLPTRGHASDKDPHHFNGMRQRIFTPSALSELVDTFCGDQYYRGYELTALEPVAYTAYQPRLYGGTHDPGYSFASLALVKRR